ncbi:MAG: peptide-methionine (R)-S-oxide reductase MsrB [Desulfovibrio sp.]|nr:peptide-methionine (R)-S-oxide reductase MsrB [Desulfovibrio sp.]
MNQRGLSSFPSREKCRLQYTVTQQGVTEPAFTGAHWNRHEPGIYVDVVTGEPLFASSAKFDSGTGWASFTRPIGRGHVTRRLDESHGMRRIEARSAGGNSHLGHIFPDGPTGLRYCINDAALRFIPEADMEKDCWKNDPDRV